MKTTTEISNAQIISRALWLAFQASAPTGLGFFHTASATQQTEESLAEAVKPRGKPDGSLELYTDYVFGRMMKTGFKVSADGKLTITPAVPRHDYQSWAGTYGSDIELIAAVEKSLGKQA